MYTLYIQVQLCPSRGIALRHHVTKNNKAQTPSKLSAVFSRPAAYFNPYIIFIYVRILCTQYALYIIFPIFPE